MVHFVYLDGKVVNLLVPEDEIPRICEGIEDGEIWIRTSKKTMFWTSMDQIRYINVIEQDDALES